MRTKILRCEACGAYTLEGTCPDCGGRTGSSAPARFSPEDPYGEYRRKLKRQQQEEEDAP